MPSHLTHSTPRLPEKRQRLAWLYRLLHLGADGRTCVPRAPEPEQVVLPHIHGTGDDAHAEDEAWHVAFAAQSKQSQVGVECVAAVVFDLLQYHPHLAAAVFGSDRFSDATSRNILGFFTKRHDVQAEVQFLLLRTMASRVCVWLFLSFLRRLFVGKLYETIIYLLLP